MGGLLILAGLAFALQFFRFHRFADANPPGTPNPWDVDTLLNSGASASTFVVPPAFKKIETGTPWGVPGPRRCGSRGAPPRAAGRSR